MENFYCAGFESWFLVTGYWLLKLVIFWYTFYLKYLDSGYMFDRMFIMAFLVVPGPGTDTCLSGI